MSLNDGLLDRDRQASSIPVVLSNSPLISDSYKKSGRDWGSILVLATVCILFFSVGAASIYVLAHPDNSTPTYPIPDTRQRVQSILANMTLPEKVHMLHGPSWNETQIYTGNVFAIDRLLIPSLRMNDGPQGFRGIDAGTSTAWPAALSLGATWDVDLARQWGEALAKEFAQKGANVLLGPGMNVARVPQNGRNFEYIGGEDPCLTSTLAGPLITGIQSQGVIAVAKHYI